MYTALTVLATSVAALVFVFFLGEELNIRRHATTVIASWTPVFLPLLTLVGAAFVYSVLPIVLFYRAWRRNDVMNDNRHERHLSLLDSAIDSILCFLVFLFLVTIVRALGISDNDVSRQASAFTLSEVLFYTLVVVYGLLTINGAVRTYAEKRFDSNSSLRRVAWIRNPDYVAGIDDDNDARPSVANLQQDRHVASPVYSTDRYKKRALYQYNKVVYFATPSLLPLKWLDFAHIVMLLLYKLAIVLSAGLLFLRVRQIGREASTLDALATTTAMPTIIHASQEDEWSGFGDVAMVHHHIIHSLREWRGHVVPLAVVFIPLFISQGVLVIYSIPQAVAYMWQRRPAADYLVGVAYFIFHAMCILFEALLAARVDVGAAENNGWHSTLAPLYTALLVVFLTSVVLLVAGKSPSGGGNRWGLYA